MHVSCKVRNWLRRVMTTARTLYRVMSTVTTVIVKVATMAVVPRFLMSGLKVVLYPHDVTNIPMTELISP